MRWTPDVVADIVGDDGMTVTQFAERVELSASRASRILARAVDAGVVTTDNGGSGKAPAVYSKRP